MATILYRAFDTAGRLIYVGISDGIFLRLGQHADNSGWVHHAATITLERFDERADAEAAELAAIRTEDPVWNVSGRPYERYVRWMAAYPNGDPDTVDVAEIESNLRAVIDRLDRG